MKSFYFSSTIFLSLILFWFNNQCYAQGATVPVSSSIYPFLERAEALQILSKPLPSQRPLTRVEIADLLSSIDTNNLTDVDKHKYQNFLIEYHFERTKKFFQHHGTRSQWLKNKLFYWFPNWMYASQNDFYHYQGQDFAIRIQPRVRFDRTKSTSKSWNAQQRTGLGWSIQSQWENIGVSFRYIDHYDRVPKVKANTFREWRTYGNSNLSIMGENESYITRNPQDRTQEKTSEEYIIATSSITYTWKKLNILLGRETVGWGPGIRQKLTLGQQISPIDQVRLDFSLLKNLRLIYLHGWLLSAPPVTDTIFHPDDARLRILDRQKYIAAHRIEWIPKTWLSIGLAEAVIYGDRAPELPYLIPVNLFYATEHNRGDNDNKSIAIDFKLNYIKGLSVYGGIWVDDLTTTKLGTGFIQNKFAYLSGITFYDPLQIKNLRWMMEYVRTDPFSGSHFYQINRYEHWGRPLGVDLPPHADQLAICADWEPIKNWQLGVESLVTRHIETTKHQNIILQSGNISSHYPPQVYQTSLWFGNGQGKIYHDLQTKITYEVFEHFWIVLLWRQKRTGYFDTQNTGIYTAQKHSTNLPDLFNWSKKTYANTQSQWVLSLLFNFDR